MSLDLVEQQMSPLLPEQMSSVLEHGDVTIQPHSFLLVPHSPGDLLLAVSLLAGVIQGLKMPLEEKK